MNEKSFSSLEPVLYVWQEMGMRSSLEGDPYIENAFLQKMDCSRAFFKIKFSLEHTGNLNCNCGLYQQANSSGKLIIKMKNHLIYFHEVTLMIIFKNNKPDCDTAVLCVSSRRLCTYLWSNISSAFHSNHPVLGNAVNRLTKPALHSF